jgi:hypothetical protein
MVQWFSPALEGTDPGTPALYQPGVCNIGTDEIARRRRSGHLGTLAAIGLLAVLAAIGAPPVTRLIVGLPAMIAASGYLQAHLRFCAGFGFIGVYNFGRRGSTQPVVDPASRARDRAMALRISLASFAIGLLVGVVAALLPV